MIKRLVCLVRRRHQSVRTITGVVPNGFGGLEIVTDRYDCQRCKRPLKPDGPVRN